MPWPLKHITVVAQCPICRGQFPDVDAFGYDACPSGCRDPQTFTATLRPVDQATGDPPQVGDCFYRPDFLKAWPGELVPKYFQLNSHRPPITVVLPPYGGDGTGNWWLVDAYASSDKRDGTGPDGWKVTGDINTTPITLHCEPSIRMGHEYHGYVRNQVVENDADGRKFDAIGRRLR